MKKALLIAGAALAASVITSQAQAVYSQNIVGYVNQVYPNGFTSIANTFELNSGNSLTNLIPNPTGALDGAFAYVWNGAGYTTYQFDSGKATGISDITDTQTLTPPTIVPGQMFFLLNNTGVAMTNVVTGTVHVDGTGTGSIGVNTNVLALGYNFISSKFPITGGVSSVLGITNNGALDGAFIYLPAITNGTFYGYNTLQFDSGKATGFSDATDVPTVPEPTVNLGTGLILLNNTGTTYNWVQSF